MNAVPLPTVNAGSDCGAHHRTGGSGRSAAMASRICWNKSRHHDLGHLECDRSTVPDDLRADLDHPVPPGGHRPMADCLGQGQGAQEAGGVVGQGMQLQPHRVRGEAVAGQAHSSGKDGL
jgi:hypothetical protein